MPLYSFECLDCKLKYDELIKYDDTGKYESVICPKCNSKNKQKVLDRCNHSFTNPVGTDKFNSHDYRYYTKLESDRLERQKALEKGPASPYTHIPDDPV